ncbi:hypothetical protein [Paracoccus alkenifer]|uniref:Uncharacterized protein n=1 Tax=Paracoccus alkenifer TaxID=65735 RepID=A0A1H6JQ81_9RHOB|nr:hypothetical protein [Paracoccus alkenifer]SEH61358.1 hypothetical protein SAMN04488075_0365 [Paracoccus alkenifer]
MDGARALIAILDTRSFASMWYWLLLAIAWSRATRGALGIPPDLIRANRRKPAGDEPPEALRLLDWVSLVAPRWRVAPGDGMMLVGAGAFLLTLLAGLGFRHGLETAQALFLLIAPLLWLAVLRVRLARRLLPSLADAQSGRLPVAEAASRIAAMVAAHMRVTLALSMAAVLAAAMWGTRWHLLHPNGL